MFHFAFATYNYETRNGNSDFRVGFFQEKHNLKGDSLHMTTVAKIRAYSNYTENFDITEELIQFQGNSLTVLQALVKYAHFSQVNIKQDSFRVLNKIMKRIPKFEQMRTAFQGENLADLRRAIFAIIIQSWELPIRGFSNFMEEVFESYVLCLDPSKIINLLEKIQET